MGSPYGAIENILTNIFYKAVLATRDVDLDGGCRVDFEATKVIMHKYPTK